MLHIQSQCLWSQHNHSEWWQEECVLYNVCIILPMTSWAVFSLSLSHHRIYCTHQFQFASEMTVISGKSREREWEWENLLLESECAVSGGKWKTDCRCDAFLTLTAARLGCVTFSLSSRPKAHTCLLTILIIIIICHMIYCNMFITYFHDLTHYSLVEVFA